MVSKWHPFNPKSLNDVWSTNVVSGLLRQLPLDNRKGSGKECLCKRMLPGKSLDEPSLSLEENIEIANLKQLIASVSAELDSVVQHLVHQLSAAEIQRDIVLALVDMQRKLQMRIQELSSTLEMLCEREVQDFLNTSKAVKHFVQTTKQSSMMKLEHSLVFLILALRQKSCQILMFTGSSVHCPPIQGRAAHSYLMFLTPCCFTKLME